MDKRLLVLSALVFTACGWFDSEEPNVQNTTARSSVYASLDVLRTSTSIPNRPPRPPNVLALYSTMFLANQPPLAMQGARNGLEIALRIVSGQTDIDEGEAYALLRELGSLLQVDVPDVLNRSQDREAALDGFVQQLVSVAAVAERKAVELDTALENLREQRRAARDTLRNLERESRNALREDRYQDASAYQKDIADAQAQVDSLETEERQIRTLLRLYDDFLEIAEERVIAIRENKRLLIAGLRVVEVPGIKELRLIEDERSARRRRETSDGNNTFGTQGLDPLNLLGE